MQLLFGEEDQKVATIAIFVHEIMEAEMASFRRENLMHQVYGVKNWIAHFPAYLQYFFFSFPAEKAFIKAECSAKKPRLTQSSLLQVLAQHT